MPSNNEEEEPPSTWEEMKLGMLPIKCIASLDFARFESEFDLDTRSMNRQYNCKEATLKVWTRAVQAECYWSTRNESRAKTWKEFKDRIYQKADEDEMMHNVDFRKSLEKKILALFLKRLNGDIIPEVFDPLTFPTFPPYEDITLHGITIPKEKVFRFFDELNHLAEDDEFDKTRSHISYHNNLYHAIRLNDFNEKRIVFSGRDEDFFLMEHFFDSFEAAFERSMFSQEPLVFGEEGLVLSNKTAIQQVDSLWANIAKFNAKRSVKNCFSDGYVTGCMLETGIDFDEEVRVVFMNQRDIDRFAQGLATSTTISKVVIYMDERSHGDRLETTFNLEPLFRILKESSVKTLEMGDFALPDDFEGLGGLTSLTFHPECTFSESAIDCLVRCMKDPTLEELKFESFDSLTRPLRQAILGASISRDINIDMITVQEASFSLTFGREDKRRPSSALDLRLKCNLSNRRINETATLTSRFSEYMTDLCLCTQVKDLRVALPSSTFRLRIPPFNLLSHVDLHTHHDFQTIYNFLTSCDSLEKVNQELLDYLYTQVKKFEDISGAEAAEGQIRGLKGLEIKTVFHEHCRIHAGALARFQEMPKRVDGFSLLKPCRPETFDLDVKFLIIRRFPAQYMALRRIKGTEKQLKRKASYEKQKQTSKRKKAPASKGKR